MGALLFPAGTDGSVVALSVGAGSLITTPVAERKAALEAALEDYFPDSLTKCLSTYVGRAVFPHLVAGPLFLSSPKG